MAEVYTVGIWTVKPGREAESVAAWRAMGEATLSEFPGAHGTLLRAADRPGRFIRFGPWASLDEVQAWRASAAFQEGVGALRELLDGFRARHLRRQGRGLRDELAGLTPASYDKRSAAVDSYPLATPGAL